MSDLTGSIALVTGASRRVGRGIAHGLSRAGAKVYGTGRTISDADFDAAIVRAPCDHANDFEVEHLFERVDTESGPLDILVNCAWAGYERMVENGRFTWADSFWDQPRCRSDAMIGTSFTPGDYRPIGLRCFLHQSLASEEPGKRGASIAPRFPGFVGPRLLLRAFAGGGIGAKGLQ